MRALRARLTGTRRRTFEQALAAETDLETAQAVIVVEADGSLATFSTPRLDRVALAEQLVALAFDQHRHHHAGPTPVQGQQHAA